MDSSIAVEWITQRRFDSSAERNNDIKYFIPISGNRTHNRRVYIRSLAPRRTHTFSDKYLHYSLRELNRFLRNIVKMSEL